MKVNAALDMRPAMPGRPVDIALALRWNSSGNALCMPMRCGF
ncbi:hypothetical protein ACLBR5_01195 [Escherichia coli]